MVRAGSWVPPLPKSLLLPAYPRIPIWVKNRYPHSAPLHPWVTVRATHTSCHHNSSRSSLRLSGFHQGRGYVIPAAPCLRPVVLGRNPRWHTVADSETQTNDSDCGYDGVCASDGRCRCHFSRAGTLCDVPVDISGACAPITGVSIRTGSHTTAAFVWGPDSES